MGIDVNQSEMSPVRHFFIYKTKLVISIKSGFSTHISAEGVLMEHPPCYYWKKCLETRSKKILGSLGKVFTLLHSPAYTPEIIT